MLSLTVLSSPPMLLGRYNALEFDGRTARRYTVFGCVVRQGRVESAQHFEEPVEKLTLPMTRGAAMVWAEAHFEDHDPERPRARLDYLWQTKKNEDGVAIRRVSYAAAVDSAFCGRQCVYHHTGSFPFGCQRPEGCTCGDDYYTCDGSVAQYLRCNLNSNAKICSVTYLNPCLV